jgi:hypothetical protein
MYNNFQLQAIFVADRQAALRAEADRRRLAGEAKSAAKRELAEPRRLRVAATNTRAIDPQAVCRVA